MNQPDSHARDLDQMRLAHALIGIEAVAMPIQTFVAIAERRDYRRDWRQLVEHAIHIDIARVHHEIDPGEHLEYASSTSSLTITLRYGAASNTAVAIASSE